MDFLKRDSFIYMGRIRLEFSWMGMTREQTKEPLRLLAIFDVWTEKVRTLVGTELGTE